MRLSQQSAVIIGSVIAGIFAVIAAVFAAIIQFSGNADGGPSSTSPLPSESETSVLSQPEEYEIPLAESSYYDIDEQRVSSTQDSDTDIELGVVNPLGEQAPISFVGDGKLVDEENANPSGCESSSLLRQGRANIYGPGDGPIVCIETSEGNLAILRHLVGKVPGNGIVLGIELYHR